MYAIVHEKEEKLLIMMKMNGLQMFDYWIITYLFFLTMSILTFSIFYLFGRYIVSLVYFRDTSILLMVNPSY